MGKLRSGRVKRIPQIGITSDRYQFLGLDQAEPNLGDPTVGPSSIGANPIPVGQVFQPVSVSTKEGERYWTPLVGFGTTVGVISVYDNGFLPNGDNRFQRINGLNFVGTGVTVETTSIEGPFEGVGIATIRFELDSLVNQGDIGKVIYNSPSGYIDGADDLNYYNSNIGIGSTTPNVKLDVVGDGNFTGIVTARSFSGTATTAINVIGGIGSLTSLTVSGNTTLGILTVTSVDSSGNIKAPTFIGNLTGTATSVSGGTASVTSLNVTGVSTLGFLTGTNAYFTGIVTASGFVTVGPTNLNDVIIGNLKVTGITTLGVSSATDLTAQNLNISGVSTLGSVKISSGIITATSGVVTYYGDGSKLSNIITGVNISTNTTNQSQFIPYVTGTGSTTGFGISTTGLVFNPSTGNFGIGTTNPEEKLQVDGNIRVGISTTSNYIAFRGTYGDQFYNNIPYSHTFIGERVYAEGTELSELLLFKGNDISQPYGPDRIRLATSGEIRFDTAVSFGVGTNGSFESVGVSTRLINRLTITQNGNLGIGRTDPLTNLHILSKSASDDAILLIESDYSNGSEYTRSVLGFTENTGVGTPIFSSAIWYGSRPGNSYSNNNSLIISNSNKSITRSDYGGIWFAVPKLDSFNNVSVRLGAAYTNTDWNDFSIQAGLSQDGNFGIGTTAPSAKLHVQGDVRITAGLYDTNNNVGTANSILISTGSGIQWASATSTYTGNVGLGTDTYGDYVKNITGTTGEVEVSVTSGEGVSPQIGLPNDVTISNDLKVSRNLQVDYNLNVNGNITVGGTSAYLNVASLQVKDKDIILGITTNGGGTDISTDITANHGGIAIASTVGTPLVSLTKVGINTLPDTYKQIRWVSKNTMGVGTTDAWLFNYGVGIGSTQVADGVRLAVGRSISMTDDTITAKYFNGDGSNLTNITASSFTGAASSIGVSTDSTDKTRYIPFVDVTSGLTTVRTNSNLVFNPSTGRLGIGLTNPQSTLHVLNSDITKDTVIQIHHDPNSNLDAALSTAYRPRSVIAFSENLITDHEAHSVIWYGNRPDSDNFSDNNNSTIIGNLQGSNTNINSNKGGVWFAVRDLNDITTGGLLDLNSTDGSEYAKLSIQAGLSAQGNFGIGTDFPEQKLHVVGDVRITGALYDSGVSVASTTGTSGQVLQSTATGIQWTTFSGSGATLNNTPSGILYPTMSATTVGTYSTAYTSSSALTFTTTSGTLSATQFTSLSDVTKKTNIRPIENAIELTKQLNGVRFDWKHDNKPSIGVIAQDIEKIIPEIVETNEDGIKSVSYGNLIGVLIEAIKEQQLRIEELERRS